MSNNRDYESKTAVATETTLEGLTNFYSQHTLKQIGKGGQGDVILAVNNETQQKYVVKIAAIEEIDTWETIRRLEKEAEFLERIDNSHVPKTYGVIKAINPVYNREEYLLLQEYIEGESLERKTISDEQQLTSILAQAYEALSSAHAVGIKHRDVKPGNLIYDPQTKNLTLIDFGVSKSDDEETRMTTVGVVGTPGYIAPECLIGQGVPESDLYSLGITLIKLMGGSINDPQKSLANFKKHGHYSSHYLQQLELLLDTNPVRRRLAFTEGSLENVIEGEVVKVDGFIDKEIKEIRDKQYAGLFAGTFIGIIEYFFYSHNAEFPLQLVYIFLSACLFYSVHYNQKEINSIKKQKALPNPKYHNLTDGKSLKERYECERKDRMLELESAVVDYHSAEFLHALRRWNEELFYFNRDDSIEKALGIKRTHSQELVSKIGSYIMKTVDTGNVNDATIIGLQDRLLQATDQLFGAIPSDSLFLLSQKPKSIFEIYQRLRDNQADKALDEIDKQLKESSRMNRITKAILEDLEFTKELHPSDFDPSFQVTGSIEKDRERLDLNLKQKGFSEESRNLIIEKFFENYVLLYKYYK